MAIIYLIRHGQASFGLENYDELSPIGIEQAKKLGEYLKSKNILPTHIIQGNMKRHKQTTEFCLQNMNLENIIIETQPFWNEFDHREILAKYEEKYSNIENLKMDVINSLNPKQRIKEILTGAVKKWTETETGTYNETWNQFCKRIKKGLEELAGNSTKSDIIFVFTSGGAISIALKEILELNTQKTFELQLNIANASITQIRNTSSGWKLITFNDHNYFLDADNKLLTFK